MRRGIVVDLSAGDRARLEAIVADRNSPQKYAWRGRIVLLSAASSGLRRNLNVVQRSLECREGASPRCVAI